MKQTAILDCEEGRKRGCDTFCCRLIVRLQEGERDPVQIHNEKKHCVDKDPDGLCTYLDRNTHGCTVWEKRPQICRIYNCNQDPLLQVVLRDGFHSLTQLVTTPTDGLDASAATVVPALAPSASSTE